MKSHSRSTFEITELVSASSSVAVSIEESCNVCTVLWEIWIVKTLVPLLVVINNVISLWREKLSEFFICKYSIKYPYFIHGWFSTFISDSCCSGQCKEEEMELPNKCLVKHQE